LQVGQDEEIVPDFSVFDTYPLPFMEPYVIDQENALESGAAPLYGPDYRTFFTTRAELEALWGSVWISVGSVLLSALIGVPLAFLFTRFDFPGRTLFGALAALPVLLPPLVGVIAFLFLYGESGIFTRAVQWALGLERPLQQAHPVRVVERGRVLIWVR
jgi:ABC-type Fe3+ transport system permease subunit